MRTSAEANGEGQIDNQSLPEFSDDWSDGHFELGEWIGSGVCPAWIVRNASPLNPDLEGTGRIGSSSRLVGEQVSSIGGRVESGAVERLGRKGVEQ